MKPKKLWIVIVITIFVIGGFVWGNFISKNQAPEVRQQFIQIGALLPLTGNDAFWGQNIKNGVELARDEINQSGGVLDKQLEIVYEDSRSDPRISTAAVNKLISAHGVQSVIGDVISSDILAVAPIMEKNKVVLLGFGESAEITQAGDYIFRNWNSASSDAEVTGSFAAQKSKRVVVLNQNDAFGKSAKSLFVSQLHRGGAEVVFENEFEKGQSDFKAMLSKISGLDYDGIYIASFHQQAILFLKQHKELGLRKSPIFGVSSWEEGTLINFVMKNYPNTVYYGYPKPPNPTSKVVQHFRQAYQHKYNKEPEILCDNGYDALMMIAAAITHAGTYDGEKIKQSLYQLKDYEGSSGVMSFDKNGDVHKPFGLKEITENGSRWLEQ